MAVSVRSGDVAISLCQHCTEHCELNSRVRACGLVQGTRARSGAKSPSSGGPSSRPCREVDGTPSIDFTALNGREKRQVSTLRNFVKLNYMHSFIRCPWCSPPKTPYMRVIKSSEKSAVSDFGDFELFTFRTPGRGDGWYCLTPYRRRGFRQKNDVCIDCTASGAAAPNITFRPNRLVHHNVRRGGHNPRVSDRILAGDSYPPLGGGSGGKGLETPYRDKMMNVCDHLKAASEWETTRVGTL